MAFKFKLNTTVKLTCSGETGIVIGRAEYTYAKPSYLIRYAAADGRATEAWWEQGAIEAAEAPELQPET